MKAVLPLFCLFAAAAAFGADSELWLRPLPEELKVTKPSEVVPAARFFEVPVSRMDTALSWLKTVPVRPVERGSVTYFGQRAFECPAPTRAYLVRAVYENGGTGAFSLARYQTALLVSHESLGRSSGAHQTALVACLDFEPAEVFYSLSGAL